MKPVTHMGDKTAGPTVEGCASTLIVGLGQTGLSCARYLHARGIDFAVVDSRDTPPGLEALRSECPQVPVSTGGFNARAIATADCLILSPGVSLRETSIAQALGAGKVVFGDIEVFAGVVSAPVVAITGSNGKSTVTTLLGDMAERAGLSVRVGGNLGPPALDLIETDEPDLYVLELSSFQLETTYSLDAAAAVALNASPDHMDRYDNFAAYLNAKSRIYRGTGVAVVNRDDEHTCDLVKDDREVVRFTMSAPECDEFGILGEGAEAHLGFGNKRLMPVEEIALAGRHNVANALAALALGYSVGLDWEPMLGALRSFGGLAHRCELVRNHNGVRWYNDSKATNVGATVAAIEGMASAGPLVLIAGGDAKSADFSAMRSAFRATFRSVILLGRDADNIAEVVASHNPCEKVNDMRAAVQLAEKHAQPGDVVLLSPACASYDMYENYQQRGEDFAHLVRELR